MLGLLDERVVRDRNVLRVHAARLDVLERALDQRFALGRRPAPSANRASAIPGSASITPPLIRARRRCATSRSRFARTSARIFSRLPSGDAELARERLVERRQHRCLDLLDRDLELRGLAREFAGAVFGGERDREASSCRRRPLHARRSRSPAASVPGRARTRNPAPIRRRTARPRACRRSRSSRDRRPVRRARAGSHDTCCLRRISSVRSTSASPTGQIARSISNDDTSPSVTSG